ncbi:MAG: glycoside hydrolase family 97 protein [Muribaculaceae bacterium]|nr:glycoside hydrolase family 97 protein [Muribaculaceae bacterium]
MMKKFYCLMMAGAVGLGAYAFDANFVSPNGLVTAELSDAGFDVRYGGASVFQIPEFGLGEAAQATAASEPELVTFDYDMAVGKKSHANNRANRYVLSLGGKADMELMLADDGFAFRYVGPQGQEHTAYRIPDGAERYAQKWTEPYEEFFPMATSSGEAGAHWGYPTLVKAKDADAWALISEAGIERWHSASSLVSDGETYRVVPADNFKHYSGTWATPWRVAIIGTLPTLVESTLVTDLSPAPQPGDYSWVEPGSVSWIYWANNHGSNDYQIVKEYIDMAAELRLPYVLIDAEWDVMGNGGDIIDALRYAHEKGIKPLVWYNSSTAWTNGAPTPQWRLNNPADREREFAWLDSLGVAGVKIDFFRGDHQETMEYCIDLLESAARHGLMVNFHGATIPRGWQRTYPNLLSVEAVYGAEWYNNLPVLTDRAAAHNATLPFTRNVIGPMDYTPCAFSDSQHPHITTHAHELALPVLFETPLQHWADRPSSYLAQPAEVQAFISMLPTAWDETRLLSGYPGDHVAIARRSGNNWYVGVINGTNDYKDVALDWSALGQGPWHATVYADAASTANAPRPAELDPAQAWDISTTDNLPASVRLHPRGGCVLVVKGK